MPHVSLRARVYFMARPVIGERPAGGIDIAILARTARGRTQRLWKGRTGRDGRFEAAFEHQANVRGLTPTMSRLMERQRATQGLVVELRQGKEKARLPIASLEGEQRLVLPWAPERDVSVQMRKVEKVNPELKKIGKSELEDLLKRTGARIESTVPTKKAAALRKKNAQDDLDRFKKAFPKKDRIMKAIEKADKAVEISPVVKVPGRDVSVQLMHPRTLVRDMILIDKEVGTLDFQRQHYKQMYELAQSGLEQMSGAARRKAARAFARLPAPAVIATATIEVVRDSVVAVATVIVDVLNWLDNLIGRPATCGGEIGTGFGGDATPGGGGGTPSSIGLLANNDWPLKHYTTCVRDQGQRGTCTAFGITAAAECLIASDFGMWMNLSEQDLYMHQKKIWFPFPTDWYGDGYNAVYSTILQSLGRTYVFPFERDWDYNQSLSRDADDDTRTYTMSCVGYNGEACSDTNHQAELIDCYSVDLSTFEEVTTEVCNWVENAVSNIPIFGGLLSDVVGEWVCDTVTEVVEVIEQIEVCIYDTDIPPTSGFQILNAGPVWVPNPFFQNPDWTVIKGLLTARRPIVFCFEVNDSFRSPSDGYLTFNGAGEENLGGHCALITGYVENADLPSGAPSGAGGGYFIVKNSWGTGWGDQGYCYVPFDWAAEYGTAMISVNAVSP